ncbi:TetR/AcrR family transcriptional regulator [Streptomyces sp. NPDC057074]|uniref:TetR/AcrR family transcriptional regulator n=1 Tax=Streptomyces sp. NPDC057074 TaxID=3346015 RepID=UPI0036405F98
MPTSPRRRRSDALENRKRLLEVAVRVFSEQGLDAAPAVIAKQAGVGVGTLYRHFPTREVLIDAVYREHLTVLCERGRDLLARLPAVDATRTWMEHFVRYATARSGMPEVLRAVISAELDRHSDSRLLLTDTVTSLLTAGARDGSLRADVAPADVLLLLGGIACAARRTADERTRPLISLLMDALTKRSTVC